jgi:hypothetical protein
VKGVLDGKQPPGIPALEFCPEVVPLEQQLPCRGNDRDFESGRADLCPIELIGTSSRFSMDGVEIGIDRRDRPIESTKPLELGMVTVAARAIQ